MRAVAGLCSVVAVLVLLSAGSVQAASAPNRLLSVAMEAGAAAPTVLIRTAEPFDYRYTVYDSVNPVRIVVDFPGMEAGNAAGIMQTRSAPLKEIHVNRFELASGSLARVEFILDTQAEYKILTQDRDFRIVFPKLSAVAAAVPANSYNQARVAGPAQLDSSQSSAAVREMVPDQQVTVEALDFVNRDGRSYVLARLSAPAKISQPVQDGDLVRFEIRNATISRLLRRSIDASAFPSAVRSITPYVVTDNHEQTVRIAVALKGPAPFALANEGRDIALVVDDGVFAEARPPAVTTREMAADSLSLGGPAAAIDAPFGERVGGASGSQYTGQKISLVFDGADIRSILQLIGDVSGYNILAGPDVTGEITLRLIDVPWDQALRLVLNTMHLKSITEGNVVQVYTAKGFAEASKLELETKIAQSKAADEIKIRRVVEINYVNMDSVDNLAKAYDGVVVNIDKNTKKAILSGPTSSVESLARAISEIDQPERQVLIEARIIEASTDFSREIGVNWGLHDKTNFKADGTLLPPEEAGYGDSAHLGLGGSFLVDTPLYGTDSGAVLGVTFGTMGVDPLVIDAKLSALETKGDVKILSTPKVTTLNGNQATIEQGREIPYSVTSDDGIKTEFKKASLTLTVTPEINPNKSLILSIDVQNNSQGPPVPTATGTQVSIENKSAKTKVILRSGETTVVGGIYVDSEDASDSGVPFLMDIPYLGHLFKSTRVKKERRELLILITPRVLEEV